MVVCSLEDIALNPALAFSIRRWIEVRCVAQLEVLPLFFNSTLMNEWFQCFITSGGCGLERSSKAEITHKEGHEFSKWNSWRQRDINVYLLALSCYEV